MSKALKTLSMTNTPVPAAVQAERGPVDAGGMRTEDALAAKILRVWHALSEDRPQERGPGAARTDVICERLTRLAAELTLLAPIV